MKHKVLPFLGGLATAIVISSCSPATMYPAGNGSQQAESFTRQPEERPGLATTWGEERKSSMISSTFVRSSSKPAGRGVVYYNDKAGTEAMTRYSYKVDGLQTAAGNMVEWGIKGQLGFLDTYQSGSRRFVTGNKNQNYSIIVKNRCRSALEIVASVDGLDVMDGKPASFSKRGYTVQPGQTIEIQGFRTSYDKVAAFKFSSVSHSYANIRHGNTRNVGVIGIAVFTQKGVSPWTWMPDEVKKRSTAQPFATAP